MRWLVITVALLVSIPIAAKTQKSYDFDHQVYYELTQIAELNYKLVIKPKSYTFFKVQSAFLLRKSANICRSNGFTLKIVSGIQEFERLPLEPRAYPGSLIAQLTCPNLDNPKE